MPSCLKDGHLQLYVVVEGAPLFFVLKGVGLCVPSTLVIGGENRTKNYIFCFAYGSTDIYILYLMDMVYENQVYSFGSFYLLKSLGKNKDSNW